MLDGRRVLALESRRAVEIAELIRKQGGEPFVAPSMREAPLAANDAVFAFAERLAGGAFDMMMLMTGVGTRQLHRTLPDSDQREEKAQCIELPQRNLAAGRSAGIGGKTCGRVRKAGNRRCHVLNSRENC